MLNEGQFFGKEDRYHLIKKLGSGAFSEVWLADDRKGGVQVAIKVYAAKTGQGIAMFEKEFAGVHDMNHTNLLRPDYFDSWEDKPFLVLKYCKNGSTFSHHILAGNRITEAQCWRLLHDVAAGLSYLHRRQPPVLHQDIKPDNILIGDDGQYLITDFGISKTVKEDETVNLKRRSTKEQVAGTTAYMAPERFSRRPKAIMASDIWSLGAMMVELMTGEPPFGEFGGLSQKQDTPIPEIEGNYSQKLCGLVRLCLEFEARKRPSANVIEDLTYRQMHRIPWELPVPSTPMSMPEPEPVPVPKLVTNQELRPEPRPEPKLEPVYVSNPTPSPTPYPERDSYNNGSHRVSDYGKAAHWYDDNKLVWTIGAGVVLVVLVIAGFLIFGGGSRKVERPATNNMETSQQLNIDLDSVASEKLALAKDYAEKAENYRKAYGKDLLDPSNGKVEIYYTNIVDKYDEYISLSNAHPGLTLADPSLTVKLSNLAVDARKNLHTIYKMLMHEITVGESKGSTELVTSYKSRAAHIKPYIQKMLIEE